MTLLSCIDLTVDTPAGNLLRDLHWQVQSGEVWGVLGPNGCGKSSLLHTLMGLQPAATGQIVIAGKALSQLQHQKRATLMGLLPQESPFAFPMSVNAVVLNGRFAHRGWWAGLQLADKESAARALDALGIAHLAKRDVSTLSGGEKRKVALATLLCQGPQLALLDEPENHLDPGVRQTILRLFKTHFTSTNKALVMVVHDPNLALQFCTHLLLIAANGSIVQGPVDQIASAEIFSALYQHPVRLLETDQGPIALLR